MSTSGFLASSNGNGASSSNASNASNAGGGEEEEQPRQAAVKKGHGKGGKGAGEGGSSSTLAGLDHDALVEVAIKDLMGDGNRVDMVQPDKTEAPQKKPVFKLSYDDQVYLVQKVYAPVINDKDKVRTLQKADCAYQLYRDHIKWDKSIGEAIDAQKCKPDVQNAKVYTDPAIKSAFAELLLEGHPKKAELLNQVRLFAAKTRGAEVHSICYRTKQTPEPTPGADASCTEAWKNSEWDGYKWVMSVRTYAFTPRPPEDLRLRQLNDMAYFLDKVDPASPSGPEAKALAEKVKALQPAVKAKRDTNLQKLRAKNPGIISVKELDANPDDYLYHRTCGEPTVESSIENDRLVTASYQCVTVAWEHDDRCAEQDYMYRKIRGTSTWVWHGTAVGGGKDVTCP